MCFLGDEADDLDKSKTTLEMRAKALADALESKKAIEESNHIELELLRKEVEDVKQTSDKSKKQLNTSLKSKLNAERANVESLKIELEKANADVQELHKRKSKEDEFAALHTELSQAMEELNSLRGEKQELIYRLQQLEGQAQSSQLEHTRKIEQLLLQKNKEQEKLKSLTLVCRCSCT